VIPVGQNFCAHTVAARIDPKNRAEVFSRLSARVSGEGERCGLRGLERGAGDSLPSSEPEPELEFEARSGEPAREPDWDGARLGELAREAAGDGSGET
jgi:hypothetical protein